MKRDFAKKKQKLKEKQEEMVSSERMVWKVILLFMCAAWKTNVSQLFIGRAHQEWKLMETCFNLKGIILAILLLILKSVASFLPFVLTP